MKPLWQFEEGRILSTRQTQRPRLASERTRSPTLIDVEAEETIID